MSRMAVKAHRSRASIDPHGLPSDLYDYVGTKPRRRPGRPPKHDLCDWTVYDNWPECIPVTDLETDVFEAWFGDFFDELFDPST